MAGAGPRRSHATSRRSRWPSRRAPGCSARSTDALIGRAVDAGRPDGVVGLAAAAHADDPLREPAVLLLMRVLAATGQAPEALRVGREYRRRLTDETGLDPSPALAGWNATVAARRSGSAP